MPAKRTRLDRYISARLLINRRDIKLMLAQGRIWVDGVLAESVQQQVNEFSHVVVDGQELERKQPIYLMLHKPIGVVSATKDTQHQTVIDLLDCKDRDQLHIVGRLDLNTSGLVLLTNDGHWSRQLTSPENKVSKRYHVTLQNPLTSDYIQAFKEGMYFAYEDITTRPAELKILSKFEAEVILEEGKYHQIKRMFGRFRNRVVALHRHSIGEIQLDANLQPGESRPLTASEIHSHLNTL